MIGFVWAEANDHLIGANGTLPWKLPKDMQRFKNLTTGNTIVMGRRTYESFPNGPLPHRKNIVMSRDVDYQVQAPALVVNDKEQLQKLVSPDENILVIGGRKIFDIFIDDVDTLYVTQIHADFDGDTVMSPIDYSKFELVEKKEGVTDEKNIYPFTFLTYRRSSDV